ncbi:MAG TPA: hypothetical protein PLQ71_02825 [Nitrospira sp.]|nr:hypothetical protein [Nitrospira sp.]
MKTVILNLTQHAATPEQLAAGVVDLSERKLTELKSLLTFDSIPTAADLKCRAEKVERLAVAFLCEITPENELLDDVDLAAMIGGAPFFMATLESHLKERAIRPLYAFSRRDSVEVSTPDGVVKQAVFRHLGFYEA